MIKFLHAADLHLGAPFSSLTPEQAQSRRREQLDIVRAMFDAAQDDGTRHKIALAARLGLDAMENRLEAGV